MFLELDLTNWIGVKVENEFRLIGPTQLLSFPRASDGCQRHQQGCADGNVQNNLSGDIPGKTRSESCSLGRIVQFRQNVFLHIDMMDLMTC